MAEVNIPANPTLWPGMLFGPRKAGPFLPFSAPGARYFYFARNAVWLGVRLLGLGGGEVLVPAYHHGVEVEALVDAGATVRFYRVGPRWDVDLDDVRRRIGPQTRALYLIHYAGFPGPVDEMRALADQHGLTLIEDCALSLLSSDGSRPLGSTGDLSVYCLYKTLPVPNGGAMVVNGKRPYSVPEAPRPPLGSVLGHTASSLLMNLELRGGRAGRWLRGALRWVGRGTASAARIERVPTGTQHFNRAHVDLGISPLARRIALAHDLSQVVEARRRNYFFLLGRLWSVAPPLFTELAPGVCPLFYPLVVQDKAEVMAKLRARGVETIDFWRHFHPACDAAAFPDVARLRRTILEVPCHQDLTPERMARVAEAVREALAPRKKKAV
jgi:dTDP-4-amino-4,6-dideoxygalactose transaminase